MLQSSAQDDFDTKSTHYQYDSGVAVFSKKKATEILFFDSRGLEFLDLSNQAIPEERVSSSTRLVSAIPSLSLLRAVVELPKSTAPDLIEESLLEAAYEQLGLDVEEEYVMQYQRRGMPYDAARYEYDVFLLPHAVIHERFEGLVESHPYIDCLIPYIFIPQVLYKRGYLSPKGSQVFIHMGDDDAFFLLFDEGEAIYSKSLETKIGNLRELFMDRTGLDLGREEFAKYLTGRAPDSESYEGALSYLYQTLFSEIEETLSFARRLHPNVRPEIIYLNTAAKFKEELYSYLGEMLMVPCARASSIPLGMDYSRDSIMATLAILYARAVLEGESLPNFTIYRRPDPFLKRDGGRVVTLLGISLILSLAYPVYEGIRWWSLDQEVDFSVSQSAIFEAKAKEYQGELARLKEEKERLEKAISEKEESYRLFEASLKEIHTWQQKYVDKSRVLNDFLKTSFQSGISLENLLIEEDNGSVRLEVNASAQGQRAFSGFLRELGESGRYFEVGTEEIVKEEGRHHSLIKAVIR